MRQSNYSKLTVTDLHDLFLEAAQTERFLPAPFRKQKMSSWPEYVQSWSAYGWSDAQVMRIQPTSEQIDRLDNAIDLGLLLSKEDRQIIWAAAHSAVGRERGPKWAYLSKLLGKSRHSVKADYQAALVRLTWAIDPRRPQNLQMRAGKFG